MKSLIRFGRRMFLTGAAIAGTTMGLSLPAAALPENVIIQKLDQVLDLDFLNARPRFGDHACGVLLEFFHIARVLFFVRLKIVRSVGNEMILCY